LDSGGLRFRRHQRLLAAREFRAVLAARCRSQDHHFTVYARGNGLADARLGLTVSRKVSPKAVVRNRLKRLIRESFRHHRPALAGLDLVVVARPPAAALAGAGVADVLLRHWTRLGTRCRR
jgi:ribonuclease P protein component